VYFKELEIVDNSPFTTPNYRVLVIENTIKEDLRAFVYHPTQPLSRGYLKAVR
jgi:hypothetical protein